MPHPHESLRPRLAFCCKARIVYIQKPDAECLAGVIHGAMDLKELSRLEATEGCFLDWNRSACLG